MSKCEALKQRLRELKRDKRAAASAWNHKNAVETRETHLDEYQCKTKRK